MDSRPMWLLVRLEYSHSLQCYASYHIDPWQLSYNSDEDNDQLAKSKVNDSGKSAIYL